ncbi:MAG: hypothetical protein SCABRO_00920 [Candidatus Scalindua brodae]|uniref:Uncharacterized protein n=1 Tax=Candidatus Scalindua brodae TaxID=237368 RepID=A0A0B0ERL6_9BACT|nr:MAG: hypothetical protein SCABRO_00920 [Candidatus Scalindua brodae]
MDDAILDGKKVAAEAKGIEKVARKQKSRHAKL